MKVVVAIDSLKGCLSSREANAAARDGILRARPCAEVVTLPVSDGGDGFLEAVHAAVGGEWVTREVCDPLMRPVRARYLLSGTTAFIEMAQASGLCLLAEGERNPLIASSYGTGQLLADALRRDVQEIVVGLGGSATSDCGQGMLQALEAEAAMPHVGHWPAKVRVVIATDVDNPLYGPQGAAYVFARQKGATDDMIAELDRRAAAFASASARRMGRDLSSALGAGAAGGVGYALMQFLGARREPGAALLLRLARFDDLLSGAHLVITGEGRADRQTLMGKMPSAILRCARERNTPVWLVAGQVADAPLLREAGFARILCFNPEGLAPSEAMRPDVARRNMADCVCRFL